MLAMDTRRTFHWVTQKWLGNKGIATTAKHDKMNTDNTLILHCKDREGEQYHDTYKKNERAFLGNHEKGAVDKATSAWKRNTAFALSFR